jgi:pimeloyl-ACP methyl ester carboxylesterase
MIRGIGIAMVFSLCAIQPIHAATTTPLSPGVLFGNGGGWLVTSFPCPVPPRITTSGNTVEQIYSCTENDVTITAKFTVTIPDPPSATITLDPTKVYPENQVLTFGAPFVATIRTEATVAVAPNTANPNRTARADLFNFESPTDPVDPRRDPGCPSIDTCSANVTKMVKQGNNATLSSSYTATINSVFAFENDEIINGVKTHGFYFYIDGEANFSVDGTRVFGLTSAEYFYPTLPSTDLTMQVVDPNCASPSDVICNSAFTEEDVATSFATMRIINNAPALVGASALRSGVVADGVTMLLLRASVPEASAGGSITLSLLDSSGGAASSKWGTLLKRDGTGGGNTITISPEVTSGGRRYAFAAYRAPIDHPVPTAIASTTLTIESVSSDKPTEKVRTPLRILSPPVVLVHGVWSNRSAWEGLEGRLKLGGFRVCPDCRPDYGTAQPAPEFDPQSPATRYVMDILIQAIAAAKSADRRQGIAVSQVDGIGHSMGGLLLRARVVYPLVDYKRFDNYKKGDLHKIITVGSPHQGSSIVNFLIEHACETDHVSAGGSFTDPTLGQFFGKIGKPLGPAIFSFQTSSPAIRNIGRTVVPGHAIIGVEPVTSATEGMLLILTRSIDARDAGGNPFTIDGIGGGEGHHDTIVPVPSQSGLIGAATTTINGIVHADISLSGGDTGETESVEVWNRMVELLRASIDSDFGIFQALQVAPGDPVRTDCSASRKAVLPVFSPSAATITPLPGTLVHPGDSLPLSLTVSGATQVEGAIFIAGDRLQAVPGSGPFTIIYPISGKQMGRVNISAGTYGNGTNFGADTFVVVQPNATPTSIQAFPTETNMTGGQTLQLWVAGTFDGIGESNITSSTAGTTYGTQSGNSTIVSVSPEGLVTARKGGRETVTVRNGSQTASVAITVRNRVRAVHR